MADIASEKVSCFAVRTFPEFNIFLQKSFDPSSWAASLFGPNIFKSCLLNSSTIPSTKGASGPTIVNSISCSFAILI